MYMNKKTACGVLSLVMLVALAAPVLAQRVVTAPAGTVIPLRMDTYLSSDSSRAGERFTATVFRSVVVDGRVVVPENAKIEGHVTSATPTDRGSKTGTLGVTFDRIVFPTGSPVQIEGTLTTLNEEGRRRIEQEVRYPEDAVRTRRSVVFLGAAEGSGATIGVPGGRAEGTTIGGILGVLLGSGSYKAEVRPGTEFGMMVERAFTVDTNILADDRDFHDHDNDGRTPPQSILTSADSIRSAQIALRSRNYYNGPINGVMNQATRDALNRFQHDRNIAISGELDVATARALGIPVDVTGPSEFTSAEAIRFAQITLRDRGYYTGPINGVMSQSVRNAIRVFQRDRNLTVNGDLDQRTARELGIASDAGIESSAIEIVNPRAERIDADSIRISADVHTQGGGWEVFVNRFVTGDTLHVYVRGVPPRYPTGSGVDHHPFAETYNGLPNIARVIIHGPQRDFTADLRGGSTVIGNPRLIAILASRFLQDFQRDLNMRNNRGQVIFDTRRDFKPKEVEVLFQITSLQAAAELYNQLTASVTDPDAVRGAASGLVRQARLLERIMRRDPQLRLSSILTADWQQLQTELARINVTDANLDADVNR